MKTLNWQLDESMSDSTYLFFTSSRPGCYDTYSASASPKALMSALTHDDLYLKSAIHTERLNRLKDDQRK
jgi:hypothetical protein